MRSSSDSALGTLNNWRNQRTPIHFRVSSGKSLNFDGYGSIKDPVALGKDLVFESDLTIGPAYTFSLTLPLNALPFAFSFEDAIKEQFGISLEELKPEERGRVLAERFDFGIGIKFVLAPDVKCTLVSAPFGGRLDMGAPLR